MTAHSSSLHRRALLLAASLAAQIASRDRVRLRAEPAEAARATSHLGEAVGVATNSQGQHLRLHAHRRDQRDARRRRARSTHGGSRLFEFDQTGKFVREIGQGVYGFIFAHAVRVDPQDNIWVVDRRLEHGDQVRPRGPGVMMLGRKPEAINVRAWRDRRPLAAAARRSAPDGRGAVRRRRGGGGGAGRRRRRRGRGAGLRAGVARRQLQSADRRRLGRAGNIFVADG